MTKKYEQNMNQMK